MHKQLSILPFRIEDVLPSKSLEFFLSTQHWMDAFPPPREPHYARLCAYLKTQLSAERLAAAPARRPPPAPMRSMRSSYSTSSGSWPDISDPWPSIW